jgi:hypothetical protein
VWSDLLETNHWVDLAGSGRSEAALVRQLRKGVRTGEWLAWRIIRIEREEMGVFDG